MIVLMRASSHLYRSLTARKSAMASMDARVNTAGGRFLLGRQQSAVFSKSDRQLSASLLLFRARPRHSGPESGSRNQVQPLNERGCPLRLDAPNLPFRNRPICAHLSRPADHSLSKADVHAKGVHGCDGREAEGRFGAGSGMSVSGLHEEVGRSVTLPKRAVTNSGHSGITPPQHRRRPPTVGVILLR
jgi:hypothetical protein